MFPILLILLWDMVKKALHAKLKMNTGLVVHFSLFFPFHFTQFGFSQIMRIMRKILRMKSQWRMQMKSKRNLRVNIATVWNVNNCDVIWFNSTACLSYFWWSELSRTNCNFENIYSCIIYFVIYMQSGHFCQEICRRSHFWIQRGDSILCNSSVWQLTHSACIYHKFTDFWCWCCNEHSNHVHMF